MDRRKRTARTVALMSLFSMTDTRENVPVASFDGDGSDLVSLIVVIDPVQAGSGDPSPTNIRPISGWTGATVTRTGKNLLAFAGDSSTSQGITWTANSNGTFTVNGTSTAFSGKKCGVVNLRKGVTYRVSGSIRDKINAYLYKSGLGIIGGTDTGSGVVYTPTENIDNVDFYVSVPSGRTIDNLTCYPMLSVGADAVDWEPYTADTYSITFPSSAGTVYGGTLDVTTGKLTVDRANIASYNGEPLPSTWISDRDVYAVGTTPTTGAQVVYKLANPIVYNLTPTEINTLLGTNNIWANTGEIKYIEYNV